MTTPRLPFIAAFMCERHRINQRRRAGQPGPWTDDPILANGRFCNIYRELDTVTQWIHDNIRVPFADHPHLWFMLAIARYINWPPTLAFLMSWHGAWPHRQNFSPENLTAALEKYAAENDKTYTGAYMIRAESDPNAPWYSWTKHRYIAEIVLGRLWEQREAWQWLLEGAPGRLFEFPLGARRVRWERWHAEPSLEEVWSHFQEPYFVGWGPFMAYEVVTDLRHTRYLRDAPDIYTWANAGPGAIRGLNRLYGRDLNAKPPARQTNAEMIQLMQELNTLDDPDFNETFGPWKWTRRFEARDIEHTLCEFDKYERVRLGEGKMRSKYDWRKATVLK